MMIKKIFKYIILAFVFTFVLEFCARIDDNLKYNAPLFEKYNSNRLRGKDTDGLSFNIPRVRFEKWSNNKFGFRGPELELEKNDGVERIFCMGTSETYGLFESINKEWPAQLRENLNFYKNYEVVNASTVGLGIKDYNAYLQKYIYRFDPDRIILLANPLSYFSSMERRFNSSQKIKATSDISNKTTINIISLFEYMRIFEKIRQMLNRFLPKKLIEMYQYSIRKNQIINIEQKYLRNKIALDTIPHEFINQFERDIQEIIDTLKSKNIEIILVTYPILISENNIDKYMLKFMESRRFHIELSYNGMIAASRVADSVIHHIAVKENIGFIDCNKKLPKSDVYFGDNAHYTDLGAKKMSDILAEYIVNNRKNLIITE